MSEARKHLYKKEHYVQNRERYIDKRLKAKYGISLHEYKIMNAKQAGVCAICKFPETAKHSVTKKLMPLSVDHCHKTGRVRGLLCQTCNHTLGKFEESPGRFDNAAKYLRNKGYKSYYDT